MPHVIKLSITLLNPKLTPTALNNTHSHWFSLHSAVLVTQRGKSLWLQHISCGAQWSSLYHKDNWKCRESGSPLLLSVLTGYRRGVVAQSARLSRNCKVRSWSWHHKMLQRHVTECVFLFPSFIMTWGGWRPHCQSIPRDKRAPWLISIHKLNY